MRDWITEHALGVFSILMPFSWLALGFVIVVLLPLSLLKSTRSFAGTGMVVASYLFGICTWLLGAALSFGSFGWLGLIIGLVFLGVGVVPLGIVGAIFKIHQSQMAVLLIVMSVVTLVSRFAGFYAIHKSET